MEQEINDSSQNFTPGGRDNNDFTGIHENSTGEALILIALRRTKSWWRERTADDKHEAYLELLDPDSGVASHQLVSRLLLDPHVCIEAYADGSQAMHQT